MKYSDPKAMARDLISKKIKDPKKHAFNGDNKGKVQLDTKGRSMKKPEQD